MTLKKAWLTVAKIAVALVFWLAIWVLVSFRINSELLFPPPPRSGGR